MMNMIGIMSVINHVFLTLDSFRMFRDVILMNSAICDVEINTHEPRKVRNSRINI